MRKQPALPGLEVFVPPALQAVLRCFALVGVIQRHSFFIITNPLGLYPSMLSLGIALFVKSQGGGMNLQVVLLPLQLQINLFQLDAERIDLFLPNSHVVVP